MLTRARRNMEEAGQDPSTVPLQVGNIEALPFEDEEFESVACVAVVEYLQEDEKALAELSRILKPGGTLVMAVRNKRCLFRLWDAFRFLRSRVRTMLNCKKYEGMAFKDGNGIWYKKHGPVAFKNALRKHGLEPADERYFHYYVTPVPVENVLGRVGARIAVKLECLTRNPISMFLASGYIVKAVKRGA
jgi:ubiquinone/menaquinone biosynthesis C-methylase UbiE